MCKNGGIMKFYKKILLNAVLFLTLVHGAKMQAMNFSKEMTTKEIIEKARKFKRFQQSFAEALSDIKREDAEDGLADLESEISSNISEHKAGEAQKIPREISDKSGEKLLAIMHSGMSDIKQIEHLISVCDDINKLHVFKDGSLRTILHIAVKKGFSEIVRLLVCAGANPNIKVGGKTALDVASIHAAYPSPLQIQHIRIKNFLENSEVQAFILMAKGKALPYEQFLRFRKLERLFAKITMK